MLKDIDVDIQKANTSVMVYNNTLLNFSLPTPFMSFSIPIIIRNVAEIVPPDESPGWVKQNAVLGYLYTVVASVLIYDSCEYDFLWQRPEDCLIRCSMHL
jgi:hypothetical protein